MTSILGWLEASINSGAVHCGPFIDRHHELRARGLRPIPARIALARHACRLAYTLIKTQQPFDEQSYRRARHQSER